ncbi:hypothetical protein APHAL10511_007512 [Amanita phalloides]|nr:hypothetical protein APHAL10511_007512 [Amanita phalloides]
MVFQLLLLPTEVIDTVAGNLTQTEAPRLALTCKRLYDLCIGYCYQSVLVASTRLDTISLSLQESSMRRMDRLLSDSRKRNGIRELKIRSIGVRSVYVASRYPPTHTHDIKILMIDLFLGLLISRIELFPNRS